MANNSDMTLTLRLRANADGSLAVLPNTTAAVNTLGQSADHTAAELHAMGIAGSAAGGHIATGSHTAINAVQDIPTAAASATGSLYALGHSGTAMGSQLSAGAGVAVAGINAIPHAANAHAAALHGLGTAGGAAGASITSGAGVAVQGLAAMSPVLGGVRGILVGLGGGAILAGLGNEVFQTNREFQSLRANLETTTGSAENAALAFSFVQDFAANAPFDVGQVTQSFIKLANLGLKPSEEALRSYGNTSSAQGKPIMQMIEAVADAATGEFERLKEFGIKASKEGDQVAFTFAGTTTKVGNSAAEIERYLIDLGNSRFGDSMAKQAKTIDGQLSTLGDTWDAFMDNLWDANTENAIAAWVGTAGKALHWLDVQINGAITDADQLAKIDDSILRKRASLSAHNDNGVFGSLVGGLAGYDANLVLNQIDAETKARNALIKKMGEQKKAQTNMIDGLGKTGKTGKEGDSNPANAKAEEFIQKLIDKNHELTLSERENFRIQAQAQGLDAGRLTTALSLYDANVRAEKLKKSADDAASNRHKAATNEAKAAQQTAKDFEKITQDEMRTLQQRNVLLSQGERAAYRQDLMNRLLAKGNRELAEATANEAMKVWDANKRWEATQKTKEAEKTELAALNDSYQQLTLSARAYYVEKLRAQGIAPEVIKQTFLPQYDRNVAAEAEAKVQTDAKQRVDEYAKSIKSANRELNDLQGVSSSVFSAQLGGVNALSGAFTTMQQSIAKNSAGLVELAQRKKDLAAIKMTDAAVDPKQAAADIQYRHDKNQEFTKEEKRLNQQGIAATLAGTAQMTGAFADMFGENTAERQAFHDMSMALGAIELAYSLYSNAETIASNVELMSSNVAAAATKIWEQLGIWAPIGLAVMAGSLAAWGAGAFGDSSSIAQAPKVSADTGTVLGDSTVQSESVSRIVATLNDINASQLPELRGINTGIVDLQGALASSITALFQSGGLDVSNAGFNLSSASGGFLGMFSDGYSAVDQRGIQTQSAAIGSLITNGILSAVQFNVIKRREWTLFTDSTSYETVTNQLDNRVVASLTRVFQSAGKVSLDLADKLGGDLSAEVKAYVIPDLKIDLTGLNGEDASKKLNAVISTALDTMATDVFGKRVGQYQQLGEGMLETATRIVSELAVVKDALAQSGLTMPRDAIAVADALVQTAGGLKEFQSQFADYYDKFYSDAEKQSRRQAVLIGQLQDVYLALPETRAGYRDLIDALDLNNTKDRERYSVLIKLAGAADTYYAALEDGLKNYQDKVTSAYQTASDLLKQQVSDYRARANELLTFSNSLTRGNLSTASAEQQYQSSRGEFLQLKQLLATGTVAQRQDASGKLQDVLQQYLTQSQKFYGGGLGYIKDFADAQGVLAATIKESTVKADVAQSQLDQLTQQVTALGLVNQSVLSVKDAVDAVGVAIAGMKAYQAEQQKIVFQSSNKAAFDKAETDRKAAYESPIQNRAAAVGANAAKTEGMLAWSEGASKHAFYGQATVNARTGNIVSGEAYGAANGSAGNYVKNSGLLHVRQQFASVAKIIEDTVGGALPNLFLNISSNGRGRGAKTTYSMAGISRSLPVDDVDPLVRLYAKDAVGWLADNAVDKAWSAQLKTVGFDNLGRGFTELSALVAHLKKPYQAANYDANKDYTKVNGSHRDGLARVPFDGYVAQLHKDEMVLTAPQAAAYDKPAVMQVSFTVPDWLTMARPGVAEQPIQSVAKLESLLQDAVEALEKMQEKIADNSLHAEANVLVNQAGYTQMLDKMQLQIDALEQNVRRGRMAVPK